MFSIMKSRYSTFGYEQWVRYFRYHARRRLHIDFSSEKKLDSETAQLIVPSIQAFAQGESSNGYYLRKAALKFAKNTGNRYYPEAMNLFVEEENMHSSYLKRYLEYHGIREKNGNILDMLFRTVRRIGGIRSEVTVLVTAEIIALSYYRALAKASDSQALKSICRQMVRDEIPHVIFQSYTLGHFTGSLLAKVLRIVLMEVSCLAVWIAYGRLFRAGGFSFLKLFSESMGYLRQSIIIADRAD